MLLAIDEAQRAGADFADARISEHWFESVGTRERRITQVASTNSYGVGVRALVGGSWGFSATREATADAVAATAREATAIAKANDRVAPSSVELAPVETFPDARWETPHEIDPFDVAVEDKAALLFAANEAALTVNGARFVSSSILSVKERRLLATTDGSVIDQTLMRINPNLTVTAIDSQGRDFQSRGAVRRTRRKGLGVRARPGPPGQCATLGPRSGDEANGKVREPRPLGPRAAPIEPLVDHSREISATPRNWIGPWVTKPTMRAHPSSRLPKMYSIRRVLGRTTCSLSVIVLNSAVVRPSVGTTKVFPRTFGTSSKMGSSWTIRQRASRPAGFETTREYDEATDAATGRTGRACRSSGCRTLGLMPGRRGPE